MRPAVDEGSCLRARRLLSLALDGEAAASEVLEATLHIAACEPCDRFAGLAVVLTRELRAVRSRRSRASTDINHPKGAWS